ncbi:hypothetical protein QTI05_22690 [Variovorax sp. J22R193]|uniref:hypothetical protein n=1 Tax=Variovorax fucosicus TaxID=3053517 RepID=UPI0025761571|nr:hypothetical protein [Variovorax sp. J22R193]MDM0041866.1 hypothetical protein [Variovorax sp. J22R193]
MKIADRYASAIRSSCLTVDERTTFSDTDVLGAMGLASRTLDQEGHPLAVALERLFAGDNGASMIIVQVLSDMAWRRARTTKVRLNRMGAADMAKACLAWHRDGVCKACGGHGTLVIPGSTTLGPHDCKPCRGDGKVPFERQFDLEQRELAAWLVAQMEREQSRAGPAAMKALAPRLDF